MPGAPGITLEQAAMAVEAVEGRGWSQLKAGEAFGVSQPTISQILGKHGRWGEVIYGPVFNELRLEQKRHFQVASFGLARKALEQAESSLPKASFLQAVTGYAILRDKERLDAGEPTEIHASVNLQVVTGLDKLAALLSQSLVETTDVSPDRTMEAADIIDVKT